MGVALLLCTQLQNLKIIQVGQDFKGHRFQALNIPGEIEQAGQGWQRKQNTTKLKTPLIMAVASQN